MSGKAAIVASVVVLILLAGGAVLVHMHAGEAVKSLEIEGVDLSTSGLVVELRNPTIYDVRVEELRVDYYVGGTKVLSAYLDEPVLVPAGGGAEAHLKVDFYMGGFAALLLGAGGEEEYEGYMRVSAYLGPLKVGTYEFHETR